MDFNSRFWVLELARGEKISNPGRVLVLRSCYNFWRWRKVSNTRLWTHITRCGFWAWT